MPTTVVKCSLPDCEEAATSKVAAPWSDGRFSELKTFGFACPAHAEAVVSDARGRLRSHRHAADESVGDIDLYPLATE
jgi:hypothetical protein